MDYFVTPLQNLIEEFEKLPGVGSKTAQRFAFYILNLPDERAAKFSKAILEAKSKIGYCSVCQNLTDGKVCSICSSAGRDHSVVCVTENPKDVMQMERTNEFSGVYHVLHGSISPMNNISPDDIRIKELLRRIDSEGIKEVIMATNPNIEGETTAMYISKLLKPLGVKVTRIAHGVSVGSDIESADEVTLTKALRGRVEI